MSAANIRSRQSLKHWAAKDPDAPGLSDSMRRNIKYLTRMYYAVPGWVDWKKVSDTYTRSKYLRSAGLDMHVHHVVPLCSNEVCGLHCDDNLVVITATENYKLSNHTWPDMWVQQLELELEL